MSLPILKTEVTTDPLGIGYAQMTDQQVYASMVAPTRTRQRTLTTTDLLEWSGTSQRFNKIKTAASNASDTAAKNFAAIMLVLLQSPGVNLDMKRAASLALVDGLISQGVLAAADKTALVTSATESINRFTELGIPEYQAGDINAVRNS